MNPDIHIGRSIAALAFKARSSDGFNTICRCNCSFCRMRGAVAVSAGMCGVTLLKVEDALARYRFNAGAAEHFFL